MSDPRYRVPIGELSKEAVGAKMREAMSAVQALLPGTMVAIFAFDRGPRTGMAYIADANREDVAKAVGEWAARQLPENN